MRLTSAIFVICSALAPTWADAEDMTASVSVLPGWRTPHGTYMTGLQISLPEGWKTYWRAPGDAGIPPIFSWAGSENIASAAIQWPRPDVFDSGGLQTLGYHDGVVLPIELSWSEDGPIRLAGSVEMGICKEICVPVMVDFDAVLTDGGPNPAIAAALMDRPTPAIKAGVGPVTCSATPVDKGLEVRATIPLADTGAPEIVVFEPGSPGIWVSTSTSERQGDLLIASAIMIPMPGQPLTLDRSALRLTVLGTHQAVDILGCVAGG